MTLEYSRYVEASSRKEETFYEKACRALESLNIEPDEKYANEIEFHARFSHMNVTPRGVVGFAAAAFLAMSGLIVLLLLSKLAIGVGIGLSEALFLFVVAGILSYFFYRYPVFYSGLYRMRMKAGFIQAFMYMAVYLRDNPNLEGAIRYAAENSSPPVSEELMRMIWDLENGRYVNLSHALDDFLDPWKDDREVLQTFQLFQTAINQPPDRREQIIGEAIDLMLSSYRERSKMFNQSIRVPLLALNAFGMLLPIILVVMLPVFLVFAPEVITMGVIAIIYDIVLPFLVFFFMNEIIKRRPITFEAPKVNVDDEWHISVAGIRMHIAVPAAAVLLFSIAAGMWVWNNIGEAEGSYVINAGIMLSVYVFSSLYVRGTDKKMDEIRRMEHEFGITIFNLGNMLASGYSLEMAIRKSLEEMKKLKIRKMYEKILENVGNGMLLRDAVFDDERGAIRDYPSSMISSIMGTIISSANKGSMAMARIMKSVATYLKEIFNAEVDVKDMLGEVTGSVKFQAKILNPILIGSMTAMTKLIFSVIRRIGELLRNMESEGISITTSMLSTMKNFNASIGQFSIILGIYLTESTVLLSYLYTSIEDGDNRVYLMRNIASSMKTVLIVYIITLIVLKFMLGGSEGVIMNA